MYDNLLTNKPLRRMSRGRVRFTYRIDKARLEHLGLYNNTRGLFAALEHWIFRFSSASFRFEVTKTGSVRVTQRNDDDDNYLDSLPNVLQQCLLHDTDLQGTLTNAIATATAKGTGAYV